MPQKHYDFKDTSVLDLNILMTGKGTFLYLGVIATILEIGFKREIRGVPTGLKGLPILQGNNKINMSIILNNTGDRSEHKFIEMMVKDYSHIPILVIGVNDSEGTKQHYYDIGVMGYIDFRNPKCSLEQAVLTLRHKELYFPGMVLKIVPLKKARKRVIRNSDEKIILDETEKKILKAKKKGLTDKQAGGTPVNLGVSAVQRRLRLLREATHTHTTHAAIAKLEDDGHDFS